MVLRVKAHLDIFKPTKAQRKIIQVLLDNPKAYVEPTGYYRSQAVVLDGEIILKFRQYTRETFVKRGVLVPIKRAYKNRLMLHPNLKVVEEGEDLYDF